MNRYSSGMFGLSLLLLAWVATSSQAGEGCCAHCGCRASCQKVCRLEMKEKKVEVVCWGCKCEDFCLPLPGCRGCKHCEAVCETSASPGKDSPTCTASKKFVWYDWLPGCGAELHTKKRLMKKVVTKKVPSYQWVVEDLCPECDQKCLGAAVEPGIEVPPPPLPGAKLKYTAASAAD